MSRSLLLTLGFVCVCVVVSVGAYASAPYVGQTVHDATYNIPRDDNGLTGAEIKELVQITKVEGGVATEWRYTYTVTNDNIGTLSGATVPVGDASQSDGVASFVFNEKLDGGPAYFLTSAPGWTGSLAGNTPSWSSTVADVATVSDGSDIDPDGGWTGGSNLGAVNNFSFLSEGAPWRLYEVTVANRGGTSATGYISGPTPEPCTLGLLGLSGLAAIRFFKRKRE